jgi:hypothetical protein
MKPHGLPVAECPRCGCEFDPALIYSIPHVARTLNVKPKTVMWWMAEGRMGYRVRPLNGFTHERVVTSYQLMKFLDLYWPDPTDPSFDPNGDSLAHRLWRKAQQRAHKASEAAVVARRARRQGQSSVRQDGHGGK